MGLSKTEVNLRRLLAAAPQQQNQAKLLHYVATLREQLEQLGEERGHEGLPRVSKGQLRQYSEKVEAIAAKLAEPESESSVEVLQLPSLKTDTGESPSKSEEESVYTPRGLRRRFVPLSEHRSHDTVEDNNSRSVKLDDAAQSHIEKHRHFGIRRSFWCSKCKQVLRVQQYLEYILIKVIERNARPDYIFDGFSGCGGKLFDGEKCVIENTSRKFYR